jgi:malonyl CoA-acyl carrier protein transacylase
MVESGVGTFVEVGPGQVLSGLIRKISDEVNVLRVEDLMKGEGGNGDALVAGSSG